MGKIIENAIIISSQLFILFLENMLPISKIPVVSFVSEAARRVSYQLLMPGHTRPATVGPRAFVLPNRAKKAPSIRFSIPQASLTP